MALLLLYRLLLIYSVLDESLQTAQQVSLFEVDSQSKCPDDNDLGGTPINGTYLLTPEKITFCALSCAINATCAFFSWNEYSSASNTFYCRLLPDCSRKESNADTDLYRRTFAGELITVDIQVKKGFIQYGGKECTGTVIKKWEKGSLLGTCELMCLLDDECVSITITRDQDECLFQDSCDGFSSIDQADTYKKPHIGVCVPGFSCYVSVLRSWTLSQAQTVCNEMGGQLASLQTVEEQTAMASILPRFKAGNKPQWVGLYYENGWKWLGGTLSGTISWAPDSPGPKEGMYCTLDPVSGKYTAREPSKRGNPLCEVASITSVIEHGVSSVKHELSDGDLTTCVPAPAYRIFTASRLDYAGSTTTNNVKLYGDNLKCADDIENTNVFVMNDISTALADETRKYRRCTMALQYVWKDKDLCLYHCPCVDSKCWRVVVKAKANVEGLNVCEIVIT